MVKACHFCSGPAGPQRPWAHHAAARIQHAWRVWNWRRAFVVYSEQARWPGYGHGKSMGKPEEHGDLTKKHGDFIGFYWDMMGIS